MVLLGWLRWSAAANALGVTATGMAIATAIGLVACEAEQRVGSDLPAARMAIGTATRALGAAAALVWLKDAAEPITVAAAAVTLYGGLVAGAVLAARRSEQ
jgi:hypothetical protein